jgi:hypothetical protein
MVGVNARMMTSAARMRRFVRWCWRRAVTFFTNDPRDVRGRVSYMDLGIPGIRSAERPNQAIFALVKCRDVLDKSHRFVVTSSTAKRVAMSSEALSVRPAITLGISWLAAAGDRT